MDTPPRNTGYTLRSANFLRFGVFRKFRMRTRLFLLFFSLLTATMLLVSYWYYHSSVRQTIQRYGEDTYQNLTRVNTIINLRMSKVVEKSELLITDKDLDRIFRSIDPENHYDLLRSDREMKRILAKYYNPDEWIYSYSILTSYYNFGEGYVPYQAFQDTELFQNILNGRGQLVWQPTYDFVEMFGQYDIDDCDINDFRYLFSCGMLINPVDTTGQTIRFVPTKDTLALVVNFREGFLYDCYKSLIQDDTIVFMVSPEQRLVSKSEAIPEEWIGTGWINSITEQKSGIMQITVDDTEKIVCYDTSDLTGWTLISMMEADTLASQAASTITSTVLQMVVLFLIVSLLLAFLMSTATSRPISRLIQAIGHTERGDFSQKVPAQGHPEFDLLISRFNDMNDKIHVLIHENYVVKLNEKENQIKLLNTQLNPHFMYNTLNLVNCIAIENNCSEIARIVTFLSKMLRYTVDIEHSTGNLSEEIQWLEGYIYIMSCRYERELNYRCEIEPGLYEEEVPRLFLQPFVENAFIHGFQGKEVGCSLSIYGWRQNGKRYFAIEDNGRGFDQHAVSDYLEGASSSVGIQNVHQRLKLMYGEEYGVRIATNPNQGTRVVLQFP